MKRKRMVILFLALAILSFPAYICIRCMLTPAFHAEADTGIPFHAVIAHRGASYFAPEETEPAYLLARDIGADYLEMDIQRTKDHVLIAFHDDTLERTTNVTQVFPGREKDTLEHFTLAELKQLDAGSWFNRAFPGRARPKYAGVKILTLEEIIAIAESGREKPCLYVETKSPELHPGYEQELVDLLKRHDSLGKQPNSTISKVVFQSFSKTSLERLKELAPQVPRILLVGQDMPRQMGGWDAMLRQAAAVGCGIGPVGTLAWPWNIQKAHRAGLVVHVYTVDQPWEFWLLTFFGADAFFTNRCDKSMAYYGKPLRSAPETVLLKYGY